MRALASDQCGSSSNPGVEAMWGLSLLLVLSLSPRGFSLDTSSESLPFGRGSRVTSRGSRVNGRGSRVTSRGSKNPPQATWGLSLLLPGSLPFSERFFVSGFPLSLKPTFANSNSIWNPRTRLNEFI